MTRQVRVQELIGRRVRDPNGKVAGRIESIRATWRGEECLVEEFDLGTAALLSRLGVTAGALVGWPARREPMRVPWQQLDLSDPETPRLRCAVEELG
jgi:hypothetical protein